MSDLRYRERDSVQVAENVISAVEECKNMLPQLPLLISFDAEEVRKQAAASTQRFTDGIAGAHMCLTLVKKVDLLMTGSIRIPASLCGIVGLKTTYGRTDISGWLYSLGIVKVIGPIASSVGDVMLVKPDEICSNDKCSWIPSYFCPCLQLIGRPWGEATILRLAVAIEVANLGRMERIKLRIQMKRIEGYIGARRLSRGSYHIHDLNDHLLKIAQGVVDDVL
ncbi:fatty acid amide hydrolase-like protein [Tanacetum coccineum]|uniref:Fatty acid amide hydrolase-like protein n=1 Tax=Tanacetum coccineum TaxID=301880 RepID=A0ABQ5B9M0_9ASTR